MEVGLSVPMVVMVLVEYIEEDFVGERLMFAIEGSFSVDWSRGTKWKSAREERWESGWSKD